MTKRMREAKTRECVICAEEKPIYRNFPSVCSAHDPETCLGCFSKQTITVLEANPTWDACTCPQCGGKPSTEQLQAVLPRSLVKRMKALVEKAESSSDNAWRWCLAEGCGYGCIRDASKSQKITCRKCSAKSCFTHQVPWHQGYTCEQYETSHPASAVTKSSEEVIKKTTKACPHCGWRIQKAGGCNYMSCSKCIGAWYWYTVAFDGEDKPSAAEYVGGPEPQAGLYNAPGPEILRQIIDQLHVNIQRVHHHLFPQRQVDRLNALLPPVGTEFHHFPPPEAPGVQTTPAQSAPLENGTGQFAAMTAAGPRARVGQLLTGMFGGQRAAPTLGEPQARLFGLTDAATQVAGNPQAVIDLTQNDEPRPARVSRLRPAPAGRRNSRVQGRSSNRRHNRTAANTQAAPTSREPEMIVLSE